MLHLSFTSFPEIHLTLLLFVDSRSSSSSSSSSSGGGSGSGNNNNTTTVKPLLTGHLLSCHPPLSGHFLKSQIISVSLNCSIQYL